jgi:hypothetical protein
MAGKEQEGGVAGREALYEIVELAQERAAAEVLA